MYMKTLKTTLVIVALALTGCDQKSQTSQPQKPDGPSAAAVQSFIQQNIPSYLTVQSVKVESFIDPALMRGRLSVAGEMVLNENLYETISEYDLIQLNNINSKDYDKYKQGELPSIAKTSTLKGQKATFETEYSVSKSVNGWTLDGNLPKPQVFEGSPLSSLRNHILFTDPQVTAFIDTIKNRTLAEQQKYTALNKAVLATFKQGARFKCSVTARDYGADETYQPPFVMTISETPALSEDGRDIYGNPSFSFKVPVAISWLSKKITPPPGIPLDDDLTAANVFLTGQMSFTQEELTYVITILFNPSSDGRYGSRYTCIYNGIRFSQYLSGYMGAKIQPEASE